MFNMTAQFPKWKAFVPAFELGCFATSSLIGERKKRRETLWSLFSSSEDQRPSFNSRRSTAKPSFYQISLNEQTILQSLWAHENCRYKIKCVAHKVEQNEKMKAVFYTPFPGVDCGIMLWQGRVGRQHGKMLVAMAPVSGVCSADGDQP